MQFASAVQMRQALTSRSPNWTIAGYVDTETRASCACSMAAGTMLYDGRGPGVDEVMRS